MPKWKMENMHTIQSKLGEGKRGERREREGHRNRRNWSELNWAEPGRTWSEVESMLPLTENRLAVLGWVYIVWLPLSCCLAGQSCLCLLRAYRFLSAQNVFDFDREREVTKKINVNLQLPPDKKGVDLHISVLLLLFWSSEVAPVNCGSPSRKWRGLTKWRPRFVCVCVCVCGKSMSIIFMTLTCFVGQSDPSTSSRGWSRSMYLLSASSSTSFTSFTASYLLWGCWWLFHKIYISVTVAPLYVRVCAHWIGSCFQLCVTWKPLDGKGRGLGLYLYMGCSNWG